MIVSAKSAFARLGPSTATSAIASSSPGNAISDVDGSADHVVYPAAEIAGDCAEQRANDRRDADHHEADDEARCGRRRARARKDVASELVEPERMGQRSDRRAAAGDCCADGSMRRQRRSDERPTAQSRGRLPRRPSSARSPCVTHNGCADRASRTAGRSDRLTATYVTAMSRMQPCTSRVVAQADRLDQQAADARPGEDRLGDRPRRSAPTPNCRPRTVTIGIRLLRKACCRTARATRDAAGARGEHVELAQLFEHAGARHPREDRGERRSQRHRRQHQMRERAAARDRQPAELDRKHDREQRTEPEVRHRDADQRQAWSPR